MRRVRRGILAAVALATVTVAIAACAGSSGATTRTRAQDASTIAPAPGISNTAEVVMGTLVGPPTQAFLSRVRRGLMGGVLFLGNDWLTKSTAARVTSELQQAACTRGEPLLIGVDQEGGIVRRLAWAPPTEAPSDMQSPTDAHAQGVGTAWALRSVGIDVDFAPVVDTPSSNANFLGSRAYSHSRTWNARMARAFVTGLQGVGGVAATAKHFPGLGRAGGNTDNGKIVIDAAAWKLRADLAPFQAAVKAGVKLVMVGTGIYPNLDASRRPAAFSPKIVQGLLRKTLGFRGVTVTDSLTAPAAVAIHDAPAKAVLAGDDLLLYGSESSSELAYATLVSDAAARPQLRARLAQAAGRIRALKASLATTGGPTCNG
jgi:beta-N-acetylhexosaminidase